MTFHKERRRRTRRYTSVVLIAKLLELMLLFMLRLIAVGGDVKMKENVSKKHIAKEYTMRLCSADRHFLGAFASECLAQSNRRFDVPEEKGSVPRLKPKEIVGF